MTALEIVEIIGLISVLGSASISVHWKMYGLTLFQFGMFLIILKLLSL